jgi:membrane protein DedA with SNARE-associated domain
MTSCLGITIRYDIGRWIGKAGYDKFACSCGMTKDELEKMDGSGRRAGHP